MQNCVCSADRLGIKRLDFGAQGGRMEFSDDTRAEPARLILLIQERTLDYRMDGPQKLRILIREEDAAKRFGEARALMERLMPEDAAEV